jgi:hypothetical protein
MFLVGNALLQLAFYAWQSGPLLRVATPMAGSADRALFQVYCLALLLTVALALHAVAGLAARGVRPRLVQVGLIAAAAAIWSLVVLDVILFRLLGLHLSSPVVTDALAQTGVDRELQVGGRPLALGTAGLGTLLVVEALYFRLCERLAARGGRRPRARRELLAATVGLALVGWAVTGSCRARTMSGTSPLARVFPLHELFVGGQLRPTRSRPRPCPTSTVI